MKKINFETKNVQIEPSCFQGKITCSYATLVKVFGKQNSGNDGYKTDAEWQLKFDNGTYATIYNWKNGKHYLGKEGKKIKDIWVWHIGGSSKKAVECVEQAIS